MNYQNMLRKVVAGHALSEEESFEAIQAILAGTVSEGQIAAFLSALATKGETVAEIIGGARAMRSAVLRLQALNANTLDTVGTGGDGGATFNISTTVAFVAAGAGATVAKHGNRASSGVSGSADCLEALGLNLAADPELMEEALNELGITFMFAPNFHKAMRHVAGIRKELGIRTLFNLLGPLTNPAAAPCQLIGVFAPALTETFAQALKQMGSRRVMVVHGHDGLDEITLTTTTRCSELHEGQVRTYDIDPLNYFEDTCSSDDLAGGTPQDNALITRAILEGKLHGPKRNIVVLNAAAALVTAAHAVDIPMGIKMATEALDSGAALEKLQKLIAFSNY